MIQITPHMRILVAIEPADFRKGIDGLAQLCRQAFKADPFSGTMFVFRNKRNTAIKILVYDGQGFWLCQKRISKGKFRSWPGGGNDTEKILQAHELQVLLFGGNPENIKTPTPWRKLNTSVMS